VHVVLDDHSRVAYAEIHDDETAATAACVLRHAVAWFTARGVRPVRVLTDNGSCHRGKRWRDVCVELGIRPKHTRPYRPQTNGKFERFNRTLAQEWVFACPAVCDDDNDMRDRDQRGPAVPGAPEPTQVRAQAGLSRGDMDGCSTVHS
jgi:transposase InsO family protein